jgi:hypothetical protein
MNITIKFKSWTDFVAYIYKHPTCKWFVDRVTATGEVLAQITI